MCNHPPSHGRTASRASRAIQNVLTYTTGICAEGQTDCSQVSSLDLRRGNFR